ncbi:hypothetical protein PMIN06_004565 [Paraphaeosphaeria minitans]
MISPGAWVGAAAGVEEVAAALDEVEEPTFEDGDDDADADANEDTEDPILDEIDAELGAELDPELDPEDASCRLRNSTAVIVAVTPALVDPKVLDAAKVGTGTVEEDELPAAEAGGISAGQRLHSPRDASQYVSTTKRRSPTASKLEKHFWNDVSS